MPYPVDLALETLHDIDVLILVGAKVPVAFFAYPGKPGRLVRDDCEVIELAQPGQDLEGALAWLADELGVRPDTPAPIVRVRCDRDALPTGALTADASRRRGPDDAGERHHLRRGDHVGPQLFAAIADAPPHDYLQLTGGAIGIGIPLAVGAAVACPDRKVIGLQADGSGMYTVQGLWTQARENLDVVTIVFANRSYAILQGEMRNVGVNEFGAQRQRMLKLDEPALDWVAMAKGMGVEAGRATTVEEFLRIFEGALGRRGPFLIEAVI